MQTATRSVTIIKPPIHTTPSFSHAGLCLFMLKIQYNANTIWDKMTVNHTEKFVCLPASVFNSVPDLCIDSDTILELWKSFLLYL